MPLDFEYYDDNYDYEGLCMWDSCVDCPHSQDCNDSQARDEEEDDN